MEEVKKIANGRPIWLTEFAAFGSTDKIKSFLDQAIPYMDKDNQIARYAYFMAHPGLLLNGNGGGLSEIGQHYVNWKAK